MKRAALLTTVILALLTFSSSSGLAHAQSGGGYDLTWSTIDGGGDTSIGGSYALMGTLGQPDAGAMSGGGYTLAGGFWPASTGRIPVAGQYTIYLPLVMRD